MVDFGATAFEGTIAPSTTVVNPVDDRSGETLASGIAQALGNFDAFLKDKIASDAVGAGEIPGSLYADITEYVNLLADGKEQGKFDTSTVFTLMRAKQNEYMANNPGQEANIQKVFTQLLSDNGLATNLQQKTPEEQAQDDLTKEALKFGWGLDPGATREEAVANYVAHQRAAQKLKDTTDRISQMQADGKLLTQADKVEAAQSLHGLIKTSYPWVKGVIDDGLDRLKGVTDPAERAAVISDVEQKITEQLAMVGDLRTRSDNAIDTSYMTKGFEDMLAGFKAVANGTEEAAQMKVQNDRTKAKIESMIMLDPEMALALTIDQITGASNAVTLEMMTSGTVRIIDQLKKSGMYKPGDLPEAGTSSNGDVPKPADIVGTEDDIAITMDVVKESIANTLADPSLATPERVQELSAAIGGMYLGVARHTADGMNPAELGEFMKFIANPSVGKFIEENMQNVDPKISQAADALTDKYYTDVGINLINDRWGTAMVEFNRNLPDVVDLGGTFLPKEQIAMTDVIIPQWNGAGIEFTIKPEFKNNAIIKAQADKLNADVSPALNNLVRAKAHMQGTRDYASVYDAEFADVLWVAGKDQGAQVTTSTMETGGINLSDYGYDTEQQATNDRNSYYDAIKAQESGGSATAKNPKSSATGLYQFLKGTWKDLVNSKQGIDAGLTVDGRTDPVQQEKAIRIFTEKNAKILKASGLEDTNGNLYAAHFLGAGTAVNVLESPDDVLLSDILTKQTLKANAFLSGKTVGWFKKWVEGVAT